MISLRRLVQLVGVAGLLLGAWGAYADEVIAGSVYDQTKENELLQKARRRAYPGGRDEGDLTVQAQLPAPVRKMSPQTEVEAEAGGDESF